MKKTYVKFVCEECGKESKEIENGTKYPYSDGWVYIYNLDFKTANDKSHIYKDKHFCCQECQKGWINKIIVRKKLDPESDNYDYKMDN